jgi:hypothetical protein
MIHASRVTSEGDVALFRDFFPALHYSRIGWFVQGISPDHYGGRYVQTVASNGHYKHHRYFNALAPKGWRTKREAQAMVDRLNARDAAWWGGYALTPANAAARDEWLADA